MEWAARRRLMYILGFLFVFGGLVSIPFFFHFSKPGDCTDGVQNGEETAIDKGGPCRILDERSLTSTSILWARSFSVHEGSYSAVAYVTNPNEHAGVRAVQYRFGLYDEKNVIVAERHGTTFIMPGAVTPIFEGNIDTGNRIVAHTYFEFTEPLVWERLENPGTVLLIGERQVKDSDVDSRVEAVVENTSVAPLTNMSFVAVIFSSNGNARAASRTTITRLEAGEKQRIVFTWPTPLDLTVGRLDILPIVGPIALDTY